MSYSCIRSGNLFNSPDGMPYVGLGPGHKHTYIATGYMGTGLSQGALAGRVISDIITQGSHPLQNLLAPSRISFLQSAVTTMAVQANAAVGFFKRVTPAFTSADSTINSLAPGQGCVVRKHGELLAVHKKSDGSVECCSGVCPHMGCSVSFNDLEQTWDCPCHGSMYNAQGKALCGPTQSDLEPKHL